MRLIALALAAGLTIFASGCATPPTYYDQQSPVVTGGTPYYGPQQQMYVPQGVQPGSVQVQPGTMPPNGYVGQPTPARMQPIPATGAPMTNGGGPN